MEIDIVLLSRIQFALTVMFHYIFPPITIGLGLLLVIYEGLYLRTAQPVYGQICRFWTKIFGLNFVMGVVSGIVMEFQFGTNWSTYSRFVGDVFGSALAAEGIFAFFLESGFLAIMVFGWKKVSPVMHYLSTVLVALGSMLSAVWIVVANSWQQTPAGFHIVGEGASARAEIVDFWAMVFNPSSVDRLVHTLLGAFLLGAFVVMSVSAYYLIKKVHHEFATRSFDMALLVGMLAALLIGVSGHHQAKTVAQTQPAKLAAFEGHFVSGDKGATLYAFGIPDVEEQRVRFGLGVPGMLSFLVSGDFNRPLMGLDKFPRKDWPPVGLSFQTYHMMVGLGGLLTALLVLAVFLRWRGRLYQTSWLMQIFVFGAALALFANELGWIAAEVGRQPWVVYGLLRTEVGVSKVVQSSEVLFSIIMFSLIYLTLLVAWGYLLAAKIKHGPEQE